MLENETMKNFAMKSGMIKFMEMGDDRGSLIALESLKNIPFELKRVYFIYNTKSDKPRGFHAMRDSLQLMVCLSGSVDVILDDSKDRNTYQLDSKAEGLFIDKMIWHEMHNFTEDCVLMVLSDAYYDAYDNLDDYGLYNKMMESFM